MYSHRISPLSLAIALIVAAAQANAAALEEIIVTAQKREESIQNAPISIAAFSSEDLQAKGIGGLSDLQSQVPNLQLTAHPNSGATTRVFMRGIGNNDDQITQDPGVAVYLDGVYVARSQGMGSDVADIERVEVLRGPQGSLYGRNATGGAINFITKAPELGKFGFQENLTVGNDSLLRSRTQISVPIGETLAAQFSYLRVKKDGFVDNLGTGVDRWGDQDRTAYRIALNWEPISDVSVRYSYDRTAIRDTPAYIDLVPFGGTAPRPSAGSPFVQNLRRNDVVVQGHNLTAAWEITEDFTLKSITGFRKVSNWTNQNILTGAAGPFPLFTNYFDTPQNQFSEEFQAVGDAYDSQIAYVAGLFFMREWADSFNSTAVPSGIHANRYVTAENKAYAVFGQATYSPDQLASRLHVTLGLRESRDERKATLQNVTVLTNGTSIPGQPGEGNRTFSNFSPSLIVAYDVTETVNAYGKVVKGYKTGGYNVRASTIQHFNEGFDEENLISYEAGLKSQWLDSRVRINAAVFHEDYDDIQVNVQSNPNNITLTDVLNAGKAAIDGVELDISARPIEPLTVSINYAYLDAHFEKISDAAGNDVSAAYRFINSPHHSYTASLQYDFSKVSFGQPSFRMDYNWQGDTFTTSNDARYVIQSYGLLNARMGISEITAGTGEVSVALWGRNLEDKTYYAMFANNGLPGASFGEPRSYGIDFSYKY